MRDRRTLIIQSFSVSLIFLVILLALSKDKRVYITRSGTKYHIKSCYYIKYSRYPVSIAEAEQRGYQPCRVCHSMTKKPPRSNLFVDSAKLEVPSTKKKEWSRCVAIARSTGSRCRRMTGNVSGMCWQHE